MKLCSKTCAEKSLPVVSCSALLLEEARRMPAPQPVDIVLPLTALTTWYNSLLRPGAIDSCHRPGEAFNWKYPRFCITSVSTCTHGTTSGQRSPSLHCRNVLISGYDSACRILGRDRHATWQLQLALAMDYQVQGHSDALQHVNHTQSHHRITLVS